MYVDPYLEYRLIRSYNIDFAERDALLDKQDGRCAICHVEMDTPCIDHDHETGKVRGLLCQTCNTGLGMFRDSVRNLASAIVYLQDSGKTF